jgi:hypothetical protein
LTSFALSGANASLFQVTTATPATILPGATLEVTVQMTTTGTGLPALPPGPAPYDQGCNLLEATLTATLSSGSVQASVYGLLLVEYNYEPTLGQIIETLGYKLDVGQAQNNWNPNTSMMAVDLPGVEPGTDEVAAPLFVKASASSPVTMNVVARFSPVGILPYGWYPSTSSTTQNTVGTMSMVTDAQTSNKARMVYPPLVSGSATTPGTSKATPSMATTISRKTRSTRLRTFTASSPTRSRTPPGRPSPTCTWSPSRKRGTAITRITSLRSAT